jgi:hypothetical protein
VPKLGRLLELGRTPGQGLGRAIGSQDPPGGRQVPCFPGGPSRRTFPQVMMRSGGPFPPQRSPSAYGRKSLSNTRCCTSLGPADADTIRRSGSLDQIMSAVGPNKRVRQSALSHLL